MPPEDNPRDSEVPTQEQWIAWENEQRARENPRFKSPEPATPKCGCCGLPFDGVMCGSCGWHANPRRGGDT